MYYPVQYVVCIAGQYYKNLGSFSSECVFVLFNEIMFYVGIYLLLIFAIATKSSQFVVNSARLKLSIFDLSKFLRFILLGEFLCSSEFSSMKMKLG